MFVIVKLKNQFRKIIMRHNRIGHALNGMRQSACLVIKPIKVDNFAALFNCTPVDRTTLYWPRPIKLFILVCRDWSFFFCCLVHRGSTDDLLLLKISSGVVWQNRDIHLSRNTLYLLRPHLCCFIVLKRDLCVYRDVSLTS